MYAVVPTITTWRMMSVAPRARFDPNRINTMIAIQEGSRRPDEIVALLRQRAGGRRTAKALDTRNSLFDVIVHSQDIAVPLRRDFQVPVAFTRRGYNGSGRWDGPQRQKEARCVHPPGNDTTGG
jgi:hypothetical protein